jgi:eukaryotic-like serine/threonine-protein kinase
MEFVEGETLQHLIKRSGRLEVELALEIATQVAAGLAAVHKQKLVHRDIKPKFATDAPAEDAISTPGAFAGTPEFASPEQFAGVGVDIRSDLFSLGVVLWEMLTGDVPFRGSPVCLVHFGPDTSQTWLLVRLKQPEMPNAPQTAAAEPKES